MTTPFPVDIDAVIDEVREALEKPLQEGEFTVRMYRERYGLTDSQADSEIERLLVKGVIEKVPERRWDRGRVSGAYRVAKAAGMTGGLVGQS